MIDDPNNKYNPGRSLIEQLFADREAKIRDEKTQNQIRLERQAESLVTVMGRTSDPLKYAAQSKALDSVLDRIGSEIGPRIAGADKMAVQKVRTFLGEKSTNTLISGSANDGSQISTHIGLAKSLSTSELNDEISKQRTNLAAGAAAIRTMLPNMSTAGVSEQIKARALEQATLAASIGTLEGAKKEQRSLGLDSRTIYNNAYHEVSQIRRDRDDSALRESARSGGSGSLADSTKKLEEATNRLIQSFEKLDNAAEGSTLKTIAEKEVVAATKARRDAEIVNDENRRSSGGSKFANGLASLGSMLTAGGSIFQAGASVYGQWTYGQKDTLTRGNTALLNMQNQRFDDSRAAASGDLFALKRIQGSSERLNYAVDSSNDATDVAIVNAIGTVSSALGNAGLDGAKQVLSSLVPTGADGKIDPSQLMSSVAKNASPGKMALNAVFGAGQSLANSAPAVSASILSVKTGEQGLNTFVQAEQTKGANQEAQNYISTMAMQTKFDDMRSAYAATAGIGRQRNAFTNTLGSGSFMKGAANVGLSRAEIMQAAAQSASMLGSESDTADIITGGDRVKRGVTGSVGEYLQQKAMVRASLGSKADLDAALVNADKMGVKGSSMIQDAAGLAARSGGASTFAGAESLIAKAASAMIAGDGPKDRYGRGSNGMSATVATSVAAKQISDIDTTVTSRSISIATIQAQARIASKLGFAPGSLESQTAMATGFTEIEQAKTILSSKGTEEEKSLQLAKLGLDGYTTERLDVLREIKSGQRLTDSGADIYKVKAELEGLEKNQNRTVKEETRYQQLTSQLAKASNTPYVDTKTVSAVGNDQKIQDTAGKNSVTSGDAANSQKAKEIAAQAENKLNQSGAKLLTPDAMGKIFEQMGNAMSGIDPNAYKNLNVSTVQLNTAISRLAETVTALNLKIDPNTVAPTPVGSPGERVNNAVSKVQDFVSLNTKGAQGQAKGVKGFVENTLDSLNGAVTGGLNMLSGRF